MNIKDEKDVRDNMGNYVGTVQEVYGAEIGTPIKGRTKGLTNQVKSIEGKAPAMYQGLLKVPNSTALIKTVFWFSEDRIRYFDEAGFIVIERVSDVVEHGTQALRTRESFESTLTKDRGKDTLIDEITKLKTENESLQKRYNEVKSTLEMLGTEFVIVSKNVESITIKTGES